MRSDKGDAVRRVIGESNARSVVVAGDDLGDLSAFAAAFELKARGGDVLRVAVDSADAPPALIDQADVIVDGPTGTAAVPSAITRLNDVHESSTS